MLTLSLRERDRLALLRQVTEGDLTVRAAARRARLSARQFRRLRRRFECEGDAAVVHRGRGRPPNNRKSETLRRRALERAQEPAFYDFGPTLLAEHLARDPEIGPLNPHTLRRWLIAAGQWQVRSRRLRHRQWRERRAACGELVQMDTSVHRWFEGRSASEIVLIAMIDDATSRLFARFVPRDTGRANRQLLLDYLRRYGRMRALYADRAAHFRQPKGRRTCEDRADEPTHSLIGRALTTLDTELILALSPQAKGRIERNFRTLQDRLRKELRLRQICSLAVANAYLEDQFIPFWNQRFSVAPRVCVDAHRPLPPDLDLEALFAETATRVIANDFTIRYRNRRLQIPLASAAPTMPGGALTIEERLDGTTHYRWQDRYLELLPTPLRTAQPTPAPRRRSARMVPAPARSPFRPAPNHPWRTPVTANARRLWIWPATTP